MPIECMRRFLSGWNGFIMSPMIQRSLTVGIAKDWREKAVKNGLVV
jgi:hypothetical protein